MTTSTILACDMESDCREPVTHLDKKGYAYCTEHGIERRFWMPCRKLRPWEVRRLERDEPLTHY